MFDGQLTFENDTIVVDGVTVAATVGPDRIEHVSEFERTMVVRRKIVGAADDLPHVEKQVVDIDGVEWQVERSSVVYEVAVVTYMRYAG